MRVRDLVDRFEHAQPYLPAIWPAATEEPIVVAFAVADAVTTSIKAKKWYQNYIDSLWNDPFVMHWLADPPAVMN
jgi:hypothetical protein